MAEVSKLSSSSISGESRLLPPSLSRDSCICPVCVEIFLEPVTLPCGHTFCKPCFLNTVEKVSMCCPICRKRVSVWARSNSRNKTLVNEKLWAQVQAAFPEQCRRRQLGQEEDEEEERDDVFVPRPMICQPGEIRREYEDLITKFSDEKRALEEAERKASEEYIQRLLAEEEERLAEERRQQEEKQLQDDELLAARLSEELNSSPISESQKNARQNKVTPAKKKPQTNAGDIQKFLRPLTPKHSNSGSSSSFTANKDNTVHPRDQADWPMPQLDYYGRQVLHPASTSTNTPSSSKTDSPFSQCLKASTKRKSSEAEVCGEEVAESSTLSKRPCLWPSSQFLPETEEAVVGGVQQALILEEVLSRKQQEEEDRQLALQLQRELDKMEAQKATNRSKGSTNAYDFRQKAKLSSRTATKENTHWS